MTTSVVVPTKGLGYLLLFFGGLRAQTLKPHEVVVVAKDCDVGHVEKFLDNYSLRGFVLEQKEGYFTHALNMGKRATSGDIVIFTDNDVVPLPRWVEMYVKLHSRHPNAAGIASRDIYLDLDGMKVLPTPDDKPHVRLYRWLVRPWLEPPHPLLKRYRLGVYLTRDLNLAHGPCIPYGECYSMPLRGANMSFKREHITDAWFPEHPQLVRAPGNEQYFALQLVLKGLDIVYTPRNPVLHIAHESLSRTRDKDSWRRELEIMRKLFRELLQRHEGGPGL